ncbi:hypothetical protein HJC23_011534 [Cyclotella cryptica]|uniref:Uncharacterized protein n=1 Tax=Cyclotella cryptica TaxID=29204 RepID=A0ABD3PTY1_9STRA
MHEIRVVEQEEATSCPAAAADIEAEAASLPKDSQLDDEDDANSSDNENDEHEINITQDRDNESVSSGDDEDEEILLMLGLSDLLHDSSDLDPADDVLKRRDLRPFRKLWEMLMQWATPSTTKLVCEYHDMNNDLCQTASPISHGEIVQNADTAEEYYTRNTVEIGASRRAGIMNMLRMNVSRSLSELQKIKQYDVSDRRTVEKRLANLVNTFDCSGRAADFDMKLSAMDDVNVVWVPPSIVTLGLVADEYRYLTQSALMSLSIDGGFKEA